MAAEFFGNCQICGREHKASATSIAKHGYTIRDGWQEGACYGSGGKPIQISCDLLQGAMDAAKDYIERTNDKIAQLPANPLYENGKITMTLSRTTRTGTLTYPAGVTVELLANGEPVARDNTGKVVKSWPFYTGIKTIEAATAELVNKRISYLAKTVQQAEESVVYLADRLKNWKPSALRPVSAEDRAASAPRIHFAAKKFGRNTSICAASYMSTEIWRSTTAERKDVTCMACLKELARIDDLPRQQAEKDAKDLAAGIKSLERNIKEHQKLIKNEADPMLQLKYSEKLVELTDRLSSLKAQ